MEISNFSQFNVALQHTILLSSVEIWRRETPCWEKVNKGNQLKREISSFFVSRHMWLRFLCITPKPLQDKVTWSDWSHLVRRYHDSFSYATAAEASAGFEIFYLIFASHSTSHCTLLLKMIFFVLFAELLSAIDVYRTSKQPMHMSGKLNLKKFRRHRIPFEPSWESNFLFQFAPLHIYSHSKISLSHEFFKCSTAEWVKENSRRCSDVVSLHIRSTWNWFFFGNFSSNCFF